MKYILVTGGVISGIGKGVISSSIGAMLKACGLRVTSIKIDPYLNIDAGTFSPYEHGEVFVLDDGGEVDLDLGNYERFLDVDLHRDNNITTGKIYQNVIEKERTGDYLGKTVQVVPHITDAIQDWVERVAAQPVDKSGCTPDVCLIELGGVTGDIEGMPYVEAFRQFQFKIGHSNICIVHVSLIPQTGSGELKTKPTQMSVRELRGLGLAPDLIMCRGKTILDEEIKQKISMFCMVDSKQVISVPDENSVYKVPLLLQKQGLVEYFTEKLGLNLIESSSPRRNILAKWRELADRDSSQFDKVAIALVGKYIKLEDAYISVVKALKHAALTCKRKLVVMYVDAENLEEQMRDTDPVKYHEAWHLLCSCNGVLVPGGFGSRGTEGKIRAAEWARKTSKPFLGICLGLQVAVIEFARHVLDWKDANSTEIDPDTQHPVVIDMPEHNPGQMGGTMRLGKRKTIFKNVESVIKQLYRNKDCIEERHRHRYEVNPSFVEQFEERGLKFVGTDVDGQRMEIIELQEHPYFVAVQFHPEFLSRPLKPSAPYLGLILASTGKLTSYIARGYRLSPRSSLTEDSSSSDEELRMEAKSPVPPIPE